jgi:hypothetical protein
LKENTKVINSLAITLEKYDILNKFNHELPTMTTEPQLKRYCTIIRLVGTIKIDASLFGQYISNSLNVSSIIAQTFNNAPTPSIITTQIEYCAINNARVGAPLEQRTVSRI